MCSLRKPGLIANLAVFAVVFALLFFTTVRVSPVATDSVSLHKVNLKQRNLKFDSAVCLVVPQQVVSRVEAIESFVLMPSQPEPLGQFQSPHFNRPPPSLA